MQGIHGIQGVVGPTGSQGNTGAQSTVTGPTGAMGPIGNNGTDGVTGPTGSQGVQGIQGVTGPSGIIGPTGTQGTQGVTGPTGISGSIGSTGPSVTGPTGAMGPTGSQGIPGTSGLVGLQLYSETSSTPTLPVSQGNNSIALGSGANTAVNAVGSLAIGDQSQANIPGCVVQASGRFGSSGDAQTGRYLLRTVTVNNTATESFVDGTNGSVRLVLPDNSTWAFTATIAAHQTNASGGHAGYKIEGIVFRDSGVATTGIQGSVVKTVLGESHPVWDANLVADTTSGCLKVLVSGENTKIIRWVTLIETIEITN
jgi:hypothetical protein